jgi:hypothetical protein
MQLQMELQLPGVGPSRRARRYIPKLITSYLPAQRRDVVTWAPSIPFRSRCSVTMLDLLVYII